MPDKKGFDLGDYVEVKDRIRILYELYPQARLVTRRVAIEQLEDGEYVVVHALAYRTPDDPHPGTGTSWMKVPGTTSYTRGSEVENAETSAWGRAIGSLGILIDGSIASRQEVENKQTDGEADDQGTKTHEDGLIGVANLGKNGGASTGTDFLLRQEKDGAHVIGFRLTQGRKGYKVLAFDPLASVLARENIIGERVTCWGTMHDESFRDDKTGRLITYQIMHLDRIATADMILPAPASDSPLSEPPADVENRPDGSPVSPLRPEAESEPLPFDMAAVDAEEAGVA